MVDGRGLKKWNVGLLNEVNVSSINTTRRTFFEFFFFLKNDFLTSNCNCAFVRIPRSVLVYLALLKEDTQLWKWT